MQNAIALNGVWIQFGFCAVTCDRCDEEDSSYSARVLKCRHLKTGGWYNMFRATKVMPRLPFSQWYSFWRHMQRSPRNDKALQDSHVLCMVGNAIDVYTYADETNKESCMFNRDYEELFQIKEKSDENLHSSEESVDFAFDPLESAYQFMTIPNSRIARSQHCWIADSSHKAENCLLYANDMYHNDNFIFVTEDIALNSSPITIENSPCYDPNHKYYFIECDIQTKKPITKKAMVKRIFITIGILDLCNIVSMYTVNFAWHNVYCKWKDAYD